MDQATKPWLLLTALVIAASAACGGGGGGDTADKPPAADEDIEMSEGETPVVEPSEEATGPNAEYCSTFVRTMKAAMTSGAADQNLEGTKRAMKELEPVAPAEIKADIEKFADYVNQQTDPKMIEPGNMPADVMAVASKPYDFAMEHCDNLKAVKPGS
jgi:hypothetical protein